MNLPEATDITVFLVEDDAALRHALTASLRHYGFQVDGFGSAEALLAVIRPDDKGVLVTDLDMPGMSGLQLQRRLLELGAEVQIVFISGQARISDSVRAMRAGAHDFIEKPFDNKTLVDAILAAAKATVAGHTGAAGLPVDELVARYNTLTKREKEVLNHVVRGISNRQIAQHLNLSDRTVEVHRSRATHKMGASSLAELVRSCLLLGIG